MALVLQARRYVVLGTLHTVELFGYERCFAFTFYTLLLVAIVVRNGRDLDICLCLSLSAADMGRCGGAMVLMDRPLAGVEC